MQQPLFLVAPAGNLFWASSRFGGPGIPWLMATPLPYPCPTFCPAVKDAIMGSGSIWLVQNEDFILRSLGGLFLKGFFRVKLALTTMGLGCGLLRTIRFSRRMYTCMVLSGLRGGCVHAMCVSVWCLSGAHLCYIPMSGVLRWVCGSYVLCVCVCLPCLQLCVHLTSTVLVCGAGR